jgi:ATP-binding cassette subfamily B protein RaxB
MIANCFGHDLDLNGLRQRFPFSMNGASLRGMMDVADRIGLNSRALRLEVSDFSQVQTPAILHWDLNHYVVLEQVRGKKAVIIDPTAGVGRVSMPLEEVSLHFTGLALEFDRKVEFTPISARAPVRIKGLFSGVTGLRRMLMQVVGLAVVLQTISIILPLQMQISIDNAINRGDISILSSVFIGFAALVVVNAVVGLLRNWTIESSSLLMSYKLVSNVVTHLINLPSDFFERRHIGDIMSRLSSVKSIQDIVTKGLAIAVIDGVTAIVLIVVLFAYSPILSAIVFMSVFLSVAVSAATYRVLKTSQEKQVVQSASEQSMLMEMVRAAVTLKTMGREHERIAAWRSRYVKSINATFTVSKWQMYIDTFNTMNYGLQTSAVIYLGCKDVASGAGLSVGMMVSFLAFRQMFSDRANALANQLSQFVFLRLHLSRVGDILTVPPEANAGSVPQDLSGPTGAISLQNVSFRYGVVDRWVVQDCSLHIRAGEFIAITGASGGGKTTLMKLMLGLRVPSQGGVYLDGTEINPEYARQWRTHVGIVTQEDRLFSGSIAENISFFDPDLDMNKVISAAERAGVDADIRRMPMQYLSLVGDMGSSLSGGQKQRVLLARALYRDPKVLFLDEGTANLDEENEEKIAEMVADLSITRVVIAHRPALIRRADRVLRMSDGRLEEVEWGAAAHDSPPVPVG